MKRLSRHTVVVLLLALVTCMGGMGLAVVAFGQTGGDPDATVPLGDYTGTTPTTTTAPLSGYTTTTPATVTTTTPTTKTQTSAPTQTGQGVPATTNGTMPTRTHGSSTVPTGGTTTLPSKATRKGPTHLAFTGGEPIFVGLGGAGLMLAGLALHQRRRRAT